MSKKRLSLQLQGDHARHLQELALHRRVPKSKIVAQAIAEYFEPRGPSQEQLAILKRIEAIAKHLESLDQDQTILIETLALFIRQFLAATAAIPESQQEAARAHGRARFDQFFEQLVRHLARGTSLVDRLAASMKAEITSVPARGSME